MDAEAQETGSELEVAKQIGSRITWLREDRTWSRTDLAGRLGISQKRLARWERGERTPPAGKLIRLSELFAVSLDELIAGRKGAITREGLAHAMEHLQGLAKALGLRQKPAKKE